MIATTGATVESARVKRFEGRKKTKASRPSHALALHTFGLRTFHPVPTNPPDLRECCLIYALQGNIGRRLPTWAFDRHLRRLDADRDAFGFKSLLDLEHAVIVAQVAEEGWVDGASASTRSRASGQARLDRGSLSLPHTQMFDRLRSQDPNTHPAVAAPCRECRGSRTGAA
jgi:hypothetical protein